MVQLGLHKGGIKLLTNGTKKIAKGKVYICGSGPGNPKLITIRCHELIKKCDVILYDRVVSNEMMLKYAQDGKKVLRLKGGDPFIFGRGGEEAEFLYENGVRFEIVPGISSAIGSAIYSGIPLTHRKLSSSVAIVTGHEDPNKEEKSVHWDKLAKSVDTIVILMGIENLPKIMGKLINHGLDKDTKVAIIERGTLQDQKIIIGNASNIIEKMKESSIKPPAVIVIGEVVSLSERIGWR